MHFAFFIFPAPTTAQPGLLFFAVPPTEIFQDSLARFAILPNPPGTRLPQPCALWRSPVPAGNALAGHTQRVAATVKLGADSTSATLSLTPADKDTATGGAALSLGVHFLVAACGDSAAKATPEFPLRVVTRQAPAFLSPKPLETSSSPDISWTPVPGVPAYHVLLSDQPLKIDPEKGSVEGASIIWQAITSQTSIAYGTPDPSGNFSAIPAPPLSPGVSYNLVILNNYDGRSSLSSSAKAQSLKLFSIQGGPALSRPGNLAPAPGAALTVSANPSITFRWTSSKTPEGKAANTYKAFVYSKEKQDLAEVLIPIWQTEVTDTFAVMDAKGGLLDKPYIWKVFAVSDAGAGVVGDTTSFTYKNNVQTLSLTTRTLGPAGDTLPLGDVRVDVRPQDGGADPLPLFTLEDGKASKVLAQGGYALDFSKAGYVPARRNVTLTGAGTLEVAELLPPSPGRVSGRVVDGGGIGVANAAVTGTGADGKAFTAASDAQGYFVLGASAGGLGVSIGKPDYVGRDTSLNLKAGETRDLGNVVLEKAQAALAGTVTNDKGAPLSGCRVDVKTAGGALVRTLLTDDRGAYAAFLAPGSYVVAASRTGFAAAEKDVQLAGAAKVDFTLASGASVLKGRVTGRERLTAATSRTVPLAGAELELRNGQGVVRRIQADLRGDYVVSLDTGTYRLKARAPGKAREDSFTVSIAKVRSTVTRDVELAGLAAVQGSITLAPAAPVDPNRASVSLISLPALGLAASATPVLTGSSLSYSLEGLADGRYRLTAGLPGYGPQSEPEIVLAGGVWHTADLVLQAATRTLGFALRAGAETVPGTIRLLTPRVLDLASDKKLAPAASGTYTLDAVPDSLGILPLRRHAFTFAAAGAPDTTVALPLAFSHSPKPLSLTQGVAGLLLKTPAPVDSALVVFGYGAPTDTFRLPASQAAAAGDSVTFRIAPGARGGLLTYYFVVRSGAYTYSNEAPDRRFRAPVAPSRELAYLRVSAGDTLRMPARSRVVLNVHAYDAAGNRLDSLVDARGSVTVSAPRGLPVEVEGKAARNLVLGTGGAQPALPKRGSQAPAWDSLTVTVTLDSIRQVLRLPARVVAARVNRLLLTSALGDAPALSAPAPVGLFVSAFDTTAIPPIPLVPSPELSLDPPEAGVIDEDEIVLAPRFIGPVRVLARHVNADGSAAATELGAGRDSVLRGLNVGQTVARGDRARTFVHDRRFELGVPDSALAAPGQSVLRVYRRRLAKTFASGVADAAASGIFEISNPSGLPLAKPLRLTLGIPAAFRGRQAAIRRFDTQRLEWVGLPDSAQAGENAFGDPALSDTVSALDGSYYALITRSRPLSTGPIEIIPNPFSPRVLAARDGNTQHGTRIRLQPETDKSSEVTLSIRVYNMDGELVRLLVDHKTVPKAPVDFYWDGKTDSGRWARNGRYAVKISITATGTRETRHAVKPVVVFQ